MAITWKKLAYADQLHTQGTDTALGTLGTKNPPIDADKVVYRDSTASDALVTSTWTQIKTFFKTYFDGVYASLNGSSKVVQDPANATATPTASKIPISEASGRLADGWFDLSRDAENFSVSIEYPASTSAYISKAGLTADWDYTLPNMSTMLAGSALTAKNSFEVIAYT